MSEISMINRIAVGDILRRTSGRLPEKTAVIEGESRKTYRELNEDVNRFTNYLLDSGLEKGDCVATICGNSVQFITVFFGIAKAGLIWIPLNPGISFHEKSYILSEVRPKLLIADEIFLQGKREELKSMCPELLVIGKEAEASECLENAYRLASKEEPETHIEDRDVAQIMFTSGTTGRPKGVMTSHLSIYLASLANIVGSRMSKEDVTSIIMPLFHCAQHTLAVSFINVGATLVILPGFEPESFMNTVEKEEVTWMFALPMMYKAILYHPHFKNYDLSSLRFCLYAMAPMDRNTLEKGMKEIGAEFALASGQTEVYPGTCMFEPEDQLKKQGPYWGGTGIINDTAIMDERGNILEQGAIGEIVHRGPNVMIGYLNNPEETERSRRFGWHHTGDLGYFDEDGLLVFVDRKKDIIKTGGENVASIQVEQVLGLHQHVLHAVVIGLPHEKWIEAVTAFIVPKPGSVVEKEEIINHCKEHLGTFQIPKEVVVVDQLPMTTTGKIQKHVLRNEFRDLYRTAPK